MNEPVHDVGQPRGPKPLGRTLAQRRSSTQAVIESTLPNIQAQPVSHGRSWAHLERGKERRTYPGESSDLGEDDCVSCLSEERDVVLPREVGGVEESPGDRRGLRQLQLDSLSDRLPLKKRPERVCH